MSWDGMYPQCNCKCGKPLNADGNHPAELYAGTYTGLCHTCERAPAFVTEEHRDGATRISYAPDNPSWRRDRIEYIAYEDCNECSGTGRTYVSRSNWSVGGYHCQCKACSERFYSEPLREWAISRRRTLFEAAQATWKAELEKANLYELVKKHSRGELSDDKQEVVDSIRRRVRERYERLKTRLEERCETLHMWD